jgi:hypothetical protein
MKVGRAEKWKKPSTLPFDALFFAWLTWENAFICRKN